MKKYLLRFMVILFPVLFLAASLKVQMGSSWEAESNTGTAAGIKTVTADLEDISSEGANLFAIFEGDTLLYIGVNIYGETGQVKKEYHFHESVIMAVITRKSYGAPISESEEMEKGSQITYDSTYFVVGQEVFQLYGEGQREYLSGEKKQQFLDELQRLTDIAKAKKN